MPAHLIRRRRKARPLGYLAASVATGVATLAVPSGGGIDEAPVSERVSLTSEATVLGAVLRPASSVSDSPAAPPASVVPIPATDPPRTVRRGGSTTSTSPPPTLTPPVSVTTPGRTTTTTTTVADSTTSTSEAPSTTETTTGAP